MTKVLENSAVLENHYYGKNGHKMSAKTRNICSNADIEIIEEIAKILFPEEKIEILVSPSKKGCYQDDLIIQIINSPLFVTIAGVLLTAFLTYLGTRPQQELAKLELQEKKEKLQKKAEENNVKDFEEKIEKIFTSRKLQKNKNRRFECLRDDKNIEKDEIIAKVHSKIVAQKTIKDTEFNDYIEPLPETTNIYSEEKIHSLLVISDVKDKKYKQWIWKFEDEISKNQVNFKMKDKSFYDFYLQEVFGLRKIIARVRYDIEEYENGEKEIKDKEIIAVYKYNDIERIPIPEHEKIMPVSSVFKNPQKEIKETIRGEQVSLF